MTPFATLTPCATPPGVAVCGARAVIRSGFLFSYPEEHKRQAMAQLAVLTARLEKLNAGVVVAKGGRR